jgi:hypothetical protein
MGCPALSHGSERPAAPQEKQEEERMPATPRSDLTWNTWVHYSDAIRAGGAGYQRATPVAQIAKSVQNLSWISPKGTNDNDWGGCSRPVSRGRADRKAAPGLKCGRESIDPSDDSRLANRLRRRFRVQRWRSPNSLFPPALCGPQASRHRRRRDLPRHIHRPCV